MIVKQIENKWKAWKFGHVPKNYWDREANQVSIPFLNIEQREFFEDIKKKLTINSWNDWYKVDIKEVIEMGGKSILEKYQVFIIFVDF